MRQPWSRVRKKAAIACSCYDDLLDFNRTKLGLGIEISPTRVDLALLFADEMNQFQTAHPNRRFDLSIEGDARGSWDGPRLQQLLGNLVANAVKFGAPNEPIAIAVMGQPTEVRFEVKNRGPTIDPEALNDVFEPIKRGWREKRPINNDTSLGLGLYIARAIVKAHKGSIEARSADEQTVFTVRLPR